MMEPKNLTLTMERPLYLIDPYENDTVIREKTVDICYINGLADIRQALIRPEFYITKESIPNDFICWIDDEMSTPFLKCRSAKIATPEEVEKIRANVQRHKEALREFSEKTEYQAYLRLKEKYDNQSTN